MAGLAAGCVEASGGGHEPSPIEVVDDVGRTVSLAESPARIASLVPAVTDLILELGASDRLVVRTDHDHAPELAALPAVGGGLTPSIEWLATQRPDLVIAWADAQGRSLVERLTGLGVPVYAARMESLSDVLATAERLGRMLALEARAGSFAAAFNGRLDSVRSAVEGAQRPGVLYLIGLDPPMAAGPGTFVDEMIGIAGGRNVFADAGRLWPLISLEEVLRRRPDVIIVAEGGPDRPALEWLRDAAGWREVPAVRAGRVIEVDADLFNRPGPGLADAVRRLAEGLHPNLFAKDPGS